MRGEDAGYEDCQRFSNLNMREKGPCFELRGNQTAQTSKPLLRSKTSVFFLAVRVLSDLDLMNWI